MFPELTTSLPEERETLDASQQGRCDYQLLEHNFDTLHYVYRRISQYYLPR